MPRRAFSLPRALTGRLDRPSGRPEEWFLGSLQTRVLRVLAARGPSTVREVAEALPKRPAPAYTTVMTVLDKLFQKDLLRRKREGRGYVYVARYSQDELRSLMARHLVDELVDDFGDVALTHFASTLDGLDRRRLQKIRRGQ